MKVRNAALGIAIGMGILTSASSRLVAQEPWGAPPPEYQRNFDQQAFHDGMEGARRDFDNHRRPDVNNRDEYRHPHVPSYEREAYRDAFRHGYDVGVEHIYNSGWAR
jgi:hypothetical protein